MLKMGLHARWVQLVMHVKIVSCSVLINGGPMGLVIPSRELRQGDPLSPYLFLLCIEGLITLLQKATREKKISDIKICKKAPKVNHLLFADGSVLFY